MKALIRRQLVLLVMLAPATFGCGGPSNQQFAEFAQSGIAFTEQVPAVYDYAFAEQVNADSAELIGERELAKRMDISGDDLIGTVKNRDDTLRERIEQFNTMKQHALLLRSYFAALFELASGERAEQAGHSASGIAAQLEDMAPDIRNISIGNVPLSGLLKPAAELGVSTFQNKLLQEHLEQDYATIWEAMSLQRAMLQELRALELKRDKLAWDARAKAEVAEPLADLPTALPANWRERRLALLATSPSQTPVSAAIEAVDTLRLNFKSLATRQEGALDRLERSIVWMDALLTAYETAREGAEK